MVFPSKHSDAGRQMKVKAQNSKPGVRGGGAARENQNHTTSCPAGVDLIRNLDSRQSPR